MRAPGGRHLDVKSFDILDIKSVRISREYRFRALYNEWVRKTAEGYTHKIWVTIGDEKTRSDHRAANGQKVKINAMFIVGGEELFLPSDIAGSLEQTANCRCKVAYVKEPSHARPTAAERPQDPDTPSTPATVPFFGGTRVTNPASGRFNIDLREHEKGAHGGHAIERHVALSRGRMLRWMNSAPFPGAPPNAVRGSHGSFTSLQSANRLVNATLAASSPHIVAFINDPSRNRFRVSMFPGTKTGVEGYRRSGVYSIKPKVTYRNTYGVQVRIVKSDDFPFGFAVKTAFPFNE